MAWPVIVISYFAYMVSNIQDLIKYPTDQNELINLQNYGLKQFKADFVWIYFAIMITFSKIFSIFIKLLLNFNDTDLKKKFIMHHHKDITHKSKNEKAEALVRIYIKLKILNLATYKNR